MIDKSETLFHDEIPDRMTDLRSTKVSISVIVCTWNRASLLQTTLQSLNEQIDCDDLEIEIIVVDNNSSDGTRTIVEELAKTWRIGELRYVFESRQGKQFALNRGVRNARNDVLAFTDDDIVVSSNWLSSINRIFSRKSVDLVGGKTLCTWPDSGRPAWFNDTMLAIVGGVDLGPDSLCPAPSNYAPAGANLVARRTLFDRVGAFSEAHFRHMDYEFGERCVGLRVSVAYEPTLIVQAPVDPAILTQRYFRRWSFKAGISLDASEKTTVRTFLYVPIWIYRQLLEDCFYLLANCISSDRWLKFDRELRIWRALGAILSRWKFRTNPGGYMAWVKKYSQKNNGVY